MLKNHATSWGCVVRVVSWGCVGNCCSITPHGGNTPHDGNGQVIQKGQYMVLT